MKHWHEHGVARSEVQTWLQSTGRHGPDLIAALQTRIRELEEENEKLRNELLDDMYQEFNWVEGESMNRDDIIRLVRKACDPDYVDAWHNGFWVVTQEELERFAALVAAAERDACARLADYYDDVVIARAIRARGEA